MRDHVFTTSPVNDSSSPRVRCVPMGTASSVAGSTPVRLVCFMSNSAAVRLALADTSYLAPIS